MRAVVRDAALMRDTAGAALTVRPANEASWEDLQTVFGSRGTASRCQCQRQVLGDRDWWFMPVEERAQPPRADEPIVAKPGQKITWDEASVGTPQVFAAAGLAQVNSPTVRRRVVRTDFR